MESDTVKKFFRQKEVVAHYAQAANQVGLWLSEELVFKRTFKKEAALLELGCGAGRITIGLKELGYENIIAIDYAKEMVQEAKKISRYLGFTLDIRHGDARELRFSDAQFDGALFGFNGLMQIPKRENRLKAMREIARVIKPGAYFVFTSHDRANPKNRKYWKAEHKRWKKGHQQEELDEYGDLYRPTAHGDMYIHSPRLEDVREDLQQSGFVIEAELPRSTLANEPPHVRAFSDECRFWITRKR